MDGLDTRNHNITANFRFVGRMARREQHLPLWEIWRPSRHHFPLFVMLTLRLRPAHDVDSGFSLHRARRIGFRKEDGMVRLDSSAYSCCIRSSNECFELGIRVPQSVYNS